MKTFESNESEAVSFFTQTPLQEDFDSEKAQGKSVELTLYGKSHN